MLEMFKRGFQIFIIVIPLIGLSQQTQKISFISPEQVKDIGDAVELACTVENLNDLSLIWAKKHSFEESYIVLAIKNSLTVPDKRYSVEERSESDSNITYLFKINSVDVTDLGVYECQVIISQSHKLSETVDLKIRHPAYISENETPSSFTVKEGDVAEVKCVGEGFPRPSISWKRENNNIMPSGGHSFSGSILKFMSHRLDRGVYICIADNGIGKPDEKLIRMEVEFQPQVTTPRPKVGQARSYGIELECEVEGFPAPAVSWFKDGVKIQSVGNNRITNIATAFEKTNSVLRISLVSSNDYGDYYCNATNKLGHNEGRVQLFEPIIPVPTNF